MKQVICLILCCCCVSTLKAQHDSQISSYTFNQVLFNPAYAGGSQRLEATVLQRSQFIGFKGAPSVWNLGVSSPFALFGARHGASFALNTDKIGAFDKTNFAVSYAYWHDLPDAKLGAGVSMGGISYKLTPDWGGVVDDAIPSSSESASTAFDLGFGVYYQHQKFFASLACAHLNQPQSLVLSSDSKGLTVKRTFYLSGEYRWQTPVENLELSPSAMLAIINIVRPQLSVGANVVYYQRYWAGLSYRIGDALGATIGISFNKVFRFGFWYEYSLSKFMGSNSGNTEIFATYAFEIKFAKKEKKYKNLRFL